MREIFPCRTLHPLPSPIIAFPKQGIKASVKHLGSFPAISSQALGQNQPLKCLSHLRVMQMAMRWKGLISSLAEEY